MSKKSKMVECTYNEKIDAFLRIDLVTNLNILGIISNCKDAKIYTDDPEDPKIVLVNRHYFNYVYTDDLKLLELIRPLVAKNSHYGFSGIKSELADYLKNWDELDWESPCSVYVFESNDQIPGYECNHVRRLDESDASIIDEHYTYKGSGTYEQIRKDLSERPGFGAVDGEVLVSWVLTHPDNSLGIMYTMEDYRNRNYAYDVTLMLVDETLRLGHTPYVQIVKGNIKSENLARKCGFTYRQDAVWFGLRKRKETK